MASIVQPFVDCSFFLLAETAAVLYLSGNSKKLLTFFKELLKNEWMFLRLLLLMY